METLKLVAAVSLTAIITFVMTKAAPSDMIIEAHNECVDKGGVTDYLNFHGNYSFTCADGYTESNIGDGK